MSSTLSLVQATPLAEQRRACGGLAPGVGGRRGLEVAAAQCSGAGTALIEQDHVAAGSPPGIRLDRGAGVARYPGQDERHSAPDPVVGPVPLDEQPQPARHASAVVERHRQDRAACLSAVAESELRLGPGRDCKQQADGREHEHRAAPSH
jgi:hypothetical protein